MAKSATRIKLEAIGIECQNPELIGSFRYKGFEAKDIDILCNVDDVKKLKNKTIINTNICSKPLDIFIIDKKRRAGVFKDMGIYSLFKELKSRRT